MADVVDAVLVREQIWIFDELVAENWLALLQTVKNLILATPIVMVLSLSLMS